MTHERGPIRSAATKLFLVPGRFLKENNTKKDNNNKANLGRAPLFQKGPRL